jgi:hypothetical protein
MDWAVNTQFMRPAGRRNAKLTLPRFRFKHRYLAVILLGVAGCSSLSQQCPYNNIVTQSTSNYLPTVAQSDCQAVEDLGEGVYRLACADGREGYLIQ